MGHAKLLHQLVPKARMICHLLYVRQGTASPDAEGPDGAMKLLSQQQTQKVDYPALREEVSLSGLLSTSSPGSGSTLGEGGFETNLE